MKSVAVSVIIPAYNAARWIEATIASVVRQSFGDWEIVVVDDGSKDDTPMLVRGMADSRLRLIEQANQGPTSARNRGFAEANGTYVALLDADDEYEPGFLERTVQCLEADASFGLVATNQYLVDREGHRSIAFQASKVLPLCPNPTAVDFCRVRLSERCFPSNTAMVLRRDLIKELGGYDPTLWFGEELELVLRWTAVTRLAYLAEPLVSHHDRPGSLVKDLDRSIGGRVHLWKRILRHDPDYLATHKGYSLLRNFCLFRLAAVAIAAGHLEEARDIARIWPAAPRDLYWWAGKALSSMPSYALELVHMTLGRTKAVRLRNDPGTRRHMKGSRR
jgi:glycosyltransferase involved in cell wall biosynthesis